MTHSLSSYFIKFDDYINNVRKYVYIQLYHYIKNIQFSVKRGFCLAHHNYMFDLV